jgi:phosphoglycerate dehydrogenase-like enzyme
VISSPDAILLFEPDPPAELAAYATGLAREVPAAGVIAAGTMADALAAARDAVALVAKAQNVSAELVAAMPGLRWIQALTTGIDPLLRLRLPSGLVVTSVRGIHGPQMAELTLLLMLALARGLPRMLENQRHARWRRWGQPLLAGRRLVIVGVGAIAEAIAARCRPFGIRIVGVSGRSAAPGFDEVLPRTRLREAAATADFLVLVVPYSLDTHHLVDAEIIAAMKPNAFLINVARGGVVDEVALVEALRSRRIAGAGLDVFTSEPLAENSPLWSMDNVIVTPHIGGMSDVYAEQVLPVLAANVRAFMAGRPEAMQNRVELSQ